MKYMPQFAFYAAAVVLLAGSLYGRLAAPEHHRAALSLSFDSGQVSFRAELGTVLLALQF